MPKWRETHQHSKGGDGPFTRMMIPVTLYNTTPEAWASSSSRYDIYTFKRERQSQLDWGHLSRGEFSMAQERDVCILSFFMYTCVTSSPRFLFPFPGLKWPVKWNDTHTHNIHIRIPWTSVSLDLIVTPRPYAQLCYMDNTVDLCPGIMCHFRKK
jgi:hypothetical protein